MFTNGRIQDQNDDSSIDNGMENAGAMLSRARWIIDAGNGINACVA